MGRLTTQPAQLSIAAPAATAYAGVGPLLELPPLGVLYLAVSAAGCLLSSGCDDQAVAVLDGCVRVLDALHEASADAAVWHAAAGVAKYHCGDLRVRLLCLAQHARVVLSSLGCVL